MLSAGAALALLVSFALKGRAAAPRFFMSHKTGRKLKITLGLFGVSVSEREYQKIVAGRRYTIIYLRVSDEQVRREILRYIGRDAEARVALARALRRRYMLHEFKSVLNAIGRIADAQVILRLVPKSWVMEATGVKPFDWRVYKRWRWRALARLVRPNWAAMKRVRWFLRSTRPRDKIPERVLKAVIAGALWKCTRDELDEFFEHLCRGGCDWEIERYWRRINSMSIEELFEVYNMFASEIEDAIEEGIVYRESGVAAWLLEELYGEVDEEVLDSLPSTCEELDEAVKGWTFEELERWVREFRRMAARRGLYF